MFTLFNQDHESPEEAAIMEEIDYLEAKMQVSNDLVSRYIRDGHL